MTDAVVRQAQTEPVAWTMCFPMTDRSVRLARRHTRTHLYACAYRPEDVAVVELVVSELVTNAIRHAGARGRVVELRIEADGGSAPVTVEVSDPGAEPPRPGAAGAEDEGGRGMAIVEALALEVAWRARKPLGKTVRALVAVSREHQDTRVRE